MINPPLSDALSKGREPRERRCSVSADRIIGQWAKKNVAPKATRASGGIARVVRGICERAKLRPDVHALAARATRH
jgi:hypothetical protein